MKESMKDVDKALKEEDKREDKLAKEVSKALNERDYEERCADQNPCEADRREDQRDEDSAVKKVFEAEDKAINKEEHHCCCHRK